jgi:hypothetical protein
VKTRATTSQQGRGTLDQCAPGGQNVLPGTFRLGRMGSTRVARDQQVTVRKSLLDCVSRAQPFQNCFLDRAGAEAIADGHNLPAKGREAVFKRGFRLAAS